MIDRRIFTGLLGGAALAPALPALAPRLASAQSAKGHTVFYSAVGGDITLYAMDVENLTLTRRSIVSVPANVQYAWPHPTKPFFYVVSSTRGSGGVEGSPDDKHLAHAFRIDPATGALTPHGEPKNLPTRPIHTTVDMAGEYLLTAYNTPSSLTVRRINPDGTLGDEVAQPNKLDNGKYAHQIRVTPDNQQVILVTRGNNAPDDKVVNPGSLKVFGFKGGVLTPIAAIQPGDGMKFGPRHLDFHTTQPWVYVSIESQSKLYMYKRDPAAGLSRDPVFMKDTLLEPGKAVRPHAGTLHVHPNGRFLYQANRDSTTIDVDGKKAWAGGQNNIAVWALDPATGEPTLIQNADGHAIEMRTFAIDPSGRMLVAASVAPMLELHGALELLPAGLSVFRIGGDGKLDFVRKYDIDTGAKTLFWSGMVTLA
jgi:6-phosphogluconolactonase (cycloisomerase 2 family)